MGKIMVLKKMMGQMIDWIGLREMFNRKPQIFP